MGFHGVSFMGKTRERNKEKRVVVTKKLNKGRIGFEMKRTDEDSAIKQARKDAMLLEDNFSMDEYMEFSDLD
jgi:hypothetical protein